MSRSFYIIKGSKEFFHRFIEDRNEENSFLALVKESDAILIDGQERQTGPKNELLIIKNDYYHAITEQAHDRLGNLIEEFTTEDAEIYVHNPTKTLMEYIKASKNIGACSYVINEEEYLIDSEVEHFAASIDSIEDNIIGQHEAVMEVAKSMWYLLHTKRKKPYVIMLYGKSSLGKTELVREIARQFYKGHFLEKHLSMFKNENYLDYFFGEKPNRKTLGYDLLERESNLVFLDEIDKCPDYFYSAFYTLFDNEVFQDASYEVDISRMLIIITSNYNNEEEMKKFLGMPVFYRIDKLIHFKEFDATTVYRIATDEINRIIDETQIDVEFDEVYKIVSREIMLSGENARTIKGKIQKVIENMIFNNVSEAVDTKIKSE